MGKRRGEGGAEVGGWQGRKVAKGDSIRAVGEISKYQGGREISVKGPVDVEVLR
ncbi:MAG: hypothetical protein NUK54_10485 [Methanothrix sp.]|nr:hypothetical protein [Methanothrix sp.]